MSNELAMPIETQEQYERSTQVPEMVALLAEFTDVQSVTVAARRMRDEGYSLWDVHSPFPIHGIDHAIGIRPTILPWLVLGAGLTGLGLGVWLQWWSNAVAYPFFVSGKPLFSLPANIPVIFELTILFAALTAVFGMFLLNRLPMLYNPLFKSERFRRVTSDRFFIVVHADDPKCDRLKTAQLLESLGAVAVELVED